MEKNKYVAAFTIENNHLPTMKVSNLVVGYSRVEEFYREYSSLPENERAFLVNDIFMFEDVMEALVDHLDVVSRESSLPKGNHHSWEIGGGKVGTTLIMNEIRDDENNLIDSWVEELSYDSSPRIVGKIELPEDSIVSSNEYDCEYCGCETGSSRWGDTRHILKVRDEVYGTWSEDRVCESCYYSDIEQSLNIK